MALLERDTELAALTTALTDAADRQGSVVLIAGEPGIGKSTLVTAATSSAGLGAVPATRLVRQQLRDLGVRSVPRGPRTSTRENPAGLTDRQLDVLSLLAEGLTNADIADRLVLSVRTVDHHVSAVLQKLGVGSRQEAAVQAPDVLAGAGRGDGALAGPR